MSRDDVWESYKRGITPAKKKTKIVAAKATPEKSAAKKSAESGPPELPKLSMESLLPAQGALERKREKSLRQGSLVIDARLDLHGMTQVEAFEALAAFMQAKTKTGKRHLLIITGKGPAGAGVLRNNLEKWLGQLPEAKMILALRPAALKHGGSGAFYVILRKKA
jgi:DNA-nicking Smr family endonuclease